MRGGRWLAVGGIEKVAPRRVFGPGREFRRRRDATGIETIRATRSERTAWQQRAEHRDGSFNRSQELAGGAAWNRREEPAGVRMLRLMEERPHGALLDDAASVHHGDAIRGFRDDAQIVGDDEQRQVECGLHLAQEVQNLRLNRHSSARRR